MSTLYLIRHGQASFGTSDYDALSDRGRHQARVLGGFFLKTGIRFDACWSGTLNRQQQTLGEVRDTYLDAGLDLPLPAETAALDEYDYEAVLRALIPVIEKEDPAFICDVNGMLSDRQAFQKVFGRVMTRWASGRDSMDDLLSWSSFAAGVTTGIRDIIERSARGSQIAVFTSGGPIAASVGRVLGLDAEKTISLSWQLVNASLTRFKFSDGRISLATFNEQGHLEGQGGNSLVTYR
ncbi:histidine phosphatase family protein [uncultured Desulfosarcina sp.]|uniref:histidine phosphatase family protein n=1 Tax=uncultured Desulfosarcina sp. TaxID=218289 RepID=UPI0029C7AACC|nr:histidine phosphatase family protein [uncultured Desulfosarcina sp.]